MVGQLARLTEAGERWKWQDTHNVGANCIKRNTMTEDDDGSQPLRIIHSNVPV